jgi:Uma2 family endonuclease
MENMVKEPAPKYNYISSEEYLGFEKGSETQNEYYHGQIPAKFDASLRHNIIKGNLITNIGNYLKEKNCNILPGDIRVSTPSHDAYIYPDAVIYCGNPDLKDDKSATLLNPVVIFEILSPSTQRINKGRKFFFYQQIPSLKEYYIIDSLQRFIHAARRQSDNSWVMETITEEQTCIIIAAINNFSLSLDLIYDGSGL